MDHVTETLNLLPIISSIPQLDLHNLARILNFQYAEIKGI